ncbi:MAG: septal ring lytic transglycosylase RlpA family protein, partial [Kiloniellales bacterium]
YKVGQPYQIEGIWYYPKIDYAYSETGIASWYGPGFHGKSTANGERFDQNDLTAAHRTLPLPSMVRVTNLDNGRSIKVRVNDRGPFRGGRIIDLSRRAAQLLGFERQGTAKVLVEILEAESRQMAALFGAPEIAPPSSVTAARAPAVPTQEVTVQSLPPPGEIGSQTAAALPPVPPPPAEPATPSAVDLGPQPDGVVVQRPVRSTSIYIQAGAFQQLQNAVRLQSALARLARAQVAQAQVGQHSFYRVRIGPLASVAEADRLLATLHAGGHSDARVVIE